MLRDIRGEGGHLPERPARTPGWWSPSDEPYRTQRKGWCVGDCTDTEFLKEEPCDSCLFHPNCIKK